MSEMTQAAANSKLTFDLGEASLIVASPDTISEACFSVPVMRAIRNAHPGCKITILSPADIEPLWGEVPEIDQLIGFPTGDSHRKIARMLQAGGSPYDVSLAWEFGPAAQAFSRLGIRTRLGFPERKLSKHLTEPLEVKTEIGPIEHRVTDYLQFIELLGIDPYTPVNFATPDQKPVGPTFTLGIAPGSDFGPAAEWPVERFARLSEDIREHCEILVLPTPERHQPAVQLSEALGLPAPADVRGTADLLELLSRCNGLVTNDSSLAHLSSFIGIPSLIIFGPNEPDWKRPLGKRHRIVRTHVPCSGCLLNHCPLDHRCMLEISWEKVLDNLRELFAE